MSQDALPDPPPALDPARVVPLFQAILADFPVGFAILEPDGTALWHNAEAALACAVWSGQPRGADALPLTADDFHLPEILRAQCQALAQRWADSGIVPPPAEVTEPAHGLYARVGLHVAADDAGALCTLRLDYRRPRGDRAQEIAGAGLLALAQLSFREREVALRVRDGLTTNEIARELRRSPLTIKTQLAGIFRKLGIANRTRLVALLHR